MSYLLVFVGGGLGAAIRHGVNVAFARLGSAFPYHTLFENVTGSILLGLLAGYLALRGDASQPLRLLLVTGVLGGYTTFSTFSLDTLLMWERGQWGLASAYVGASVLASVLGLALGVSLGRYLG
jgi:fluoride exporter